MTLAAASGLPPSNDPDLTQFRHRELEQIAIASLGCARVLMETGSRAKVVQECCRLIATGLHAEMTGIRVGYASISVTLSSGINTITRMVTVNRHGMDYRLNQAIRGLVVTACASGMQPAEIRARLEEIVASSPRHPLWFVIAAVGLACAGFGLLLGTDLAAFLPVLLAGCVGQFVRHRMLHGGANPYVVTAATACFAALVGGISARFAGSHTVDLAMIASTLLLVPGVPATNAQADIMDGLPTLASARAISVSMTMVFVAAGIVFARSLLGVNQ